MIVFGTALSFAFLAAIALSMKDFIGGNASFEFSYKTLLGFAVGFGVGLLFWTVVNRWMRRADKNKQSGST